MAENRPWSDLPKELLFTIAENLSSNPIDLLSFGTVCKQWRSSYSFPLKKLFPPFPLTLPPPPDIIGYNSCYLTVTGVYALRSLGHRSSASSSSSSSSSPRKSFLFFLDQCTDDDNISTRKPLAFPQQQRNLSVTFPPKIDMLSFEVLEMGRFYNLLVHKCSKYINCEPDEVENWTSMVQKVVLFSKNANHDHGHGLRAFFVLALYEEGGLGLLRLGNKIDEDYSGALRWEIKHYGKGFHFDDIVDFKGRVLGVNRKGRLYHIDINIGCCSSSSSTSTTMDIIVPTVVDGAGRRKRLVESLSRLHLVVRRNNARVSTTNAALFKVYQLCEDTNTWVQVYRLDDQTFIVGLDFSLAVSANQLHGSCGKNWILFTHKSFSNYNSKKDYIDYKVWFGSLNADDDLCIGVCRLEDADHVSEIGSYPDYASVFWPPPSWFCQSIHIDHMSSVTEHKTNMRV